jgi:hypothetical protein
MPLERDSVRNFISSVFALAKAVSHMAYNSLRNSIQKSPTSATRSQ